MSGVDCNYCSDSAAPKIDTTAITSINLYSIIIIVITVTATITDYMGRDVDSEISLLRKSNTVLQKLNTNPSGECCRFATHRPYNYTIDLAAGVAVTCCGATA